MSKISIFLPSLNGGGAERVMVTLANAIAARGYTVDLVLASAQGPYLKDVAPDVRIVDLKAGRVIKALLPLMHYLRKSQPVALLSAMGHANVVVLLANLLAAAPTKVFVSERTSISKAHARAKGWVAKINYLLVRLLYPKASGICAVSQAASNDLEQFIGLPHGLVKTLYNPFDLRVIRQQVNSPVSHPWFEKQGNYPVILAAGRLTEAKDYPTLLRAFAKLRKTRTARLLILGEGELRKDLEAQIQSLGLENDVQLPGFVDNPYAYMAHCRLFVLSSQWEGLPSVLIQAMACGAPVVSTNCLSGPDEILAGGKWGRLVAVGDADALAAAMTEVLDSPCEQLPDVRLRAQDFEKEKAVDAYLEFMGLPKRAS